MDQEIQSLVVARSGEGYTQEEMNAITKEFMGIIPFDHASEKKIMEKISSLSNPESIVEELQKVAHKTYDQRENDLGAERMRQVERFVMLSAMDREWMNHLDSMDDLREGIWMRGGKDQVLSEYKKEAFDMFAGLLDKVNGEAVRTIFRIQVANMAQPTVPETMVTGKQEDFDPGVQGEKPKATSPDSGVGALAAALGKTANRSGKGDGRTPIMVKVDPTQQKIGRNDPCPCGSGKKWKKCGLVNAPEHNG
jgi:preprotein translocase subunit SecA